jgi:hypothetical protein
MNTKNLAQNKYVALSLYIFVMIGLVGCGTLEVGAVEAKAMGANPIEAEAVKIMNNEIQMEQENGSADLISMDQLPSDAEASPLLRDDDAIRAALAAHFGMDVSEFYNFEVKENTGMHAKGGVDNGYFLAAKVDGQWIFVDGGHAAPNCNEVAKYGFPASMVPWCEPPEDAPTDSDDDAIRAALAAYFGMDASEFYHFEVKENTGMHAKGGVDNGYFLAAKVDGQWVFVDGGHAAPNCNEVARYRFPASMVPWCPAAGSDAPDCPGSGTTVATFIEDVTYADGTKVPAGENFTKTWRIKNVGTCTWNSDYQLVFDSGYSMSGPSHQRLTDSHIAPGETLDVSVELIAPDTPGTYRGNWKFKDPYGNTFELTTGNPIWVEIKVVQNKSDQAENSSSNSDYPTIRITDVNQDRNVTITGANFPPNNTLNVFLNYNGTKGIDGILVGSSMTDASGELTDIYAIPTYLRGQTIIAIRLESPTSGYYAYNWFFNE